MNNTFNEDMTSNILAIGTAVPAARLPQAETRDFFLAQEGLDKLTSRIIRAAFDNSAIDYRHSLVGSTGHRNPLFVDRNDQLLTVTTGERNRVYQQESPRLFAAAAQDALARANVAASEITHLVTVSCTGFFAPGPDVQLIKDLGLRPTAERFHLGFMGCSAAFPALRVAARICDADPEAMVLVACAELCTIHLRSSNDAEQVVSSALFADGAAAAIVSGVSSRKKSATLAMHHFTTSLTREGKDDMSWTIGDFGFEMRLTAKVPKIIGREIASVARHMLRDTSLSASDIDMWAVHPGGRSVLDQVEKGLELETLHHSRWVLREYGNMSSATILFILKRMMADLSLPARATVAGLSFGPGLTVESALFTKAVG